ncbi:MAG: peroxidase family protein [Chloroflexia bacterium]
MSYLIGGISLLAGMALAVANRVSRHGKNGSRPASLQGVGVGEKLEYGLPKTSSVPMVERGLVAIFSVVNKRVEWHKLPLPLAVLNLLALRVQLREHNLHDTTPIDRMDDIPVSKQGTHVLYQRTPEGTFNDLQYPRMGKTGVRFGRNVPVEYTHPDPEPKLLTPSPRLVSRKLMTRTEFIPATILNIHAAAWIQFMTHDWFNHGPNRKDAQLEIPLADDDPWTDRPMRIERTPIDPTRTPEEDRAGKPPAYVNTQSHWWDGSAIYGCDDATCAALRTMRDGKLRTDHGRLPLDPETGLSITGFNGNWWIGLGLMHTLFTLEHNAIADRIKREYPGWNDEQLYQTARLVNAALMAKIHTVEWTTAILPNQALQIGMNANWWGLQSERLNKAFGRLTGDEAISGIPGSETDHHGAPFTLTEEFAAVYRLHPLIPDEITISSLETGKVLKKLDFIQVANRNAATVMDDQVGVNDLWYSFGTSHPGAVTLHNFPRFLQDLQTQDGAHVDLAAVDIMRDRERGIPRYNQFRRLIHRQPVRSFEELTPNKEWQKELREVYNNDIEAVDLQVGMFAETPPEGFGFSDTAFRIFILMASRRLKSDRFFTTDYNAKVYTQAGMDWINKNTMVTILIRHYPELAATLRGVKNAFAPWPKIH